MNIYRTAPTCARTRYTVARFGDRARGVYFGTLRTTWPGGSLWGLFWESLPHCATVVRARTPGPVSGYRLLRSTVQTGWVPGLELARAYALQNSNPPAKALQRPLGRLEASQASQRGPQKAPKGPQRRCRGLEDAPTSIRKPFGAFQWQQRLCIISTEAQKLLYWASGTPQRASGTPQRAPKPPKRPQTPL